MVRYPHFLLASHLQKRCRSSIRPVFLAFSPEDTSLRGMTSLQVSALSTCMARFGGPFFGLRPGGPPWESIKASPGKDVSELKPSTAINHGNCFPRNCGRLDSSAGIGPLVAARPLAVCCLAIRQRDASGTCCRYPGGLAGSNMAPIWIFIALPLCTTWIVALWIIRGIVVFLRTGQ